MKPNSEKSGDLFVTPMMLEQLRYSGLLEVCTIRKMGEYAAMLDKMLILIFAVLWLLKKNWNNDIITFREYILLYIFVYSLKKVFCCFFARQKVTFKRSFSFRKPLSPVAFAKFCHHTKYLLVPFVKHTVSLVRLEYVGCGGSR